MKRNRKKEMERDKEEVTERDKKRDKTSRERRR